MAKKKTRRTTRSHEAELLSLRARLGAAEKVCRACVEEDQIIEGGRGGDLDTAIAKRRRALDAYLKPQETGDGEATRKGDG